MMNTGTRCKHCGETYGMHGVGDECPTVYAHFEQEDGWKEMAFAKLDKTIPLYTAADLKAARLETIDRVMQTLLSITYVDDLRKWIACGADAIKKLKEEIANEL